MNQQFGPVPEMQLRHLARNRAVCRANIFANAVRWCDWGPMTRSTVCPLTHRRRVRRALGNQPTDRTSVPKNQVITAVHFTLISWPGVFGFSQHLTTRSTYYKPCRTTDRGQSAEVIVVPLTNCTHGSDAPETAAFEIGYFFAG